MRRSVALGTILVGAGIAWSLLPDDDENDTTVRIFAAASLTDALAEALEHFAREHPGARIVPQFGASSDLARQILAGAPADLFFSADVRQVDRLAEANALEPNASREILSNSLVLVQHRDRPTDIGIDDVATLAHIAMADPEAVPAGIYTRLYLESRGLWPQVSARVVPTLDVRGALTAVASGNVEAGFVYRTDATIDERVRIVYEVPEDEGPSIAYLLAIVKGRARTDVRALYDFLGSTTARGVFARHGFIPQGQEP